MQREARRVSLTTRVDYSTACDVVWILYHKEEGIVQWRLWMPMVKRSDGKPWLTNISRAASILGCVEGWPRQRRKANVPYPNLHVHSHVPANQQGPLPSPGDAAARPHDLTRVGRVTLCALGQPRSACWPIPLPLCISY
ncbi:hypothetical protein E2C01_058957 [Portunus trituberculatus]|uniref:Uncharacterized protein n=1 Tax=Portunus trituberculatus TaxID=210409 RepID=A0A5B7H648_PORTR|nr:hypothetical protein [Portunus trituberculatus]